MKQHSIEQRVHDGVASTQLGLAINAALAVIKVLGGVLGHSYALIADGIESSADIFSSIIVIRGLKVSERAATEEYHFGFGKAESLSAAFVSLLLLTAAGVVLITGVREIITPHHLPAPFTLIILVIVVPIKELLFRYVSRVGKETQSTAVQSDAWHHRSDAITSLAAFIGITIALWGGPGWESADDYAAIFAALVIGYNGLRMMREALGDLMDRAPEPEVIRLINEVAQKVDGVIDVEKLLVRKVGLGLFLEMHIHAHPHLSLHEAHQLSGKVKRILREKIPGILGAVIHMEPAEEVLSRS